MRVGGTRLQDRLARTELFPKLSQINSRLLPGLFTTTGIYATDLGYYVIEILDDNIGVLTLCPVVLLEVIATSYLYGLDRCLFL